MQQSESFEGISPSGARYGIDARGRYPPARTSGSGSSSSFSVASAKAVSMSHSDSPGAPQNKSSKAKLPHGLTVQELKEMTETLRHLASNCQGDNRPDCPILLSLGHAAPDEPVPPPRDRKKTRGFERL